METDVLNISLGEVTPGTFLLAAGLTVLCLVLSAAAVQLYLESADSGKPERCYEGKVLEKRTETAGCPLLGIKLWVEWIVFETLSGERLCLRNVRPKTLLIQPGDRARIVVRGQTVYVFILKF